MKSSFDVEDVSMTKVSFFAFISCNVQPMTRSQRQVRLETGMSGYVGGVLQGSDVPASAVSAENK